MTLRQHPNLCHHRAIACFLIVRGRKPGA